MKGVQILGGALTVKVLTNTLSINEFGKYSLVVALSTFLAVIPFTGINQGVFRYIKSHNDAFLLFRSIFYIYLLILALYSFLFFLLSYFLNVDLYIYFTVFLLISTVYINNLFWIDNAFEKQKKIFFLYFFDIILKISILMLLSYSKQINIFTVLITISLSTFVVYSFGVKDYFRFKKICIKESINTIQPLWLYARPIVAWSIFTWSQTMIYRIYLSIFETSEVVALFTLSSSLAIMPISGLIGVVSAYVLPKLFVNEVDGVYHYHLLNKVTLLISCFLICSTILFSFAYESIVVLFSSEAYRESSWMFPIMFTSQCIYCIGTIYSYRLYAEKRTKNLVVANVIPGVLAIFTGYYFIDNYGNTGAVISFVSSWSLCGLLLIFVTNIYSKGKELKNDN